MHKVNRKVEFSFRNNMKYAVCCFRLSFYLKESFKTLLFFKESMITTKFHIAIILKHLYLFKLINISSLMVL